jgi:arylsulfatase A-like enzyme
MYNEVVNCLLMIRRPDGVGAGQRSDALVQHHDIATTVVNFSGARSPYEFEGKDLMPIVEGKKDKVRDYATCGYCLHVWCRDDEYVLICRNTGDEPQLFDMRNDPEQNYNIASDKPEVVKRMFDLILEDAGGPVLPNWKVDPLLLKVPGVQSIIDWTEWSPFREWKMPGE